jgi:hypothetical protein
LNHSIKAAHIHVHVHIPCVFKFTFSYSPFSPFTHLQHAQHLPLLQYVALSNHIAQTSNAIRGKTDIWDVLEKSIFDPKMNFDVTRGDNKPEMLNRFLDASFIP